MRIEKLDLEKKVDRDYQFHRGQETQGEKLGKKFITKSTFKENQHAAEEIKKELNQMKLNKEYGSPDNHWTLFTEFEEIQYFNFCRLKELEPPKQSPIVVGVSVSSLYLCDSFTSDPFITYKLSSISLITYENDCSLKIDFVSQPTFYIQNGNIEQLASVLKKMFEVCVAEKIEEYKEKGECEFDAEPVITPRKSPRDLPTVPTPVPTITTTNATPRPVVPQPVPNWYQYQGPKQIPTMTPTSLTNNNNNNDNTPKVEEKKNTFVQVPTRPTRKPLPRRFDRNLHVSGSNTHINIDQDTKRIILPQAGGLGSKSDSGNISFNPLLSSLNDERDRKTYERRQTMRKETESVIVTFHDSDGEEEAVEIFLPKEQEKRGPQTTFRVVRQNETIPDPTAHVNKIYANDARKIPYLVVIPFFNEEPEELFRTIASSYLNGQSVFKQKKDSVGTAATHALLILDGYNKASERALKWCEQLFPIDAPDNENPWHILSQLRADKKEDDVVVNWLSEKAAKNECFMRGLPIESFTPSTSWTPVEVFHWSQYLLNEEIARTLLRNKVDGRGLFSLNITLCTKFGMSISDGNELLEIRDKYLNNQAKGDKLDNIAVIFQFVYEGNIHPMKIQQYVDENKEEVDETDKLFTKKGCHCNPCDCCEPPISEEPIKTFLTLIVKCRNRQKHNSHWWAIQPQIGFVSQYNFSKYIWFTDCGTLFERDCLYHLHRVLKYNKSVGAVSGRQRVMNAAQQGNKDEGWVSEFLRHVQRCDFELGFATTVGAFHSIGVLPVLPGPCGLFRTKVVQSGANNFYHSFLSMKPSDIGLIEANVMIAEDRILSISPFFARNADKGGALFSGIQTNIAPEATFYYESENNLMNLLKQRRRWINGTIASYLWLLIKQPSLMWKFPINFFYKIMLWWFYFTQAYSFLTVFLSPSIFIIAFSVAVENLPVPTDVRDDLSMDIWWYFILALYIIFSILCSTRHVGEWTLYIGAIISGVVQVFTIIALLYNIVYGVIFPTIALTANGTAITNLPQVNYFDYSVLAIVAVYMFLPLISAFFASPWSFLQIIRSGVFFLLFLPTLIGLFGIYSICHFSDFSWGNRDSSGSAEKLGGRLNVLRSRGDFFGWFFLMLNLVLIVLSKELVLRYYMYKVIATGLVFVIPMTVLLWSFVFWVIWRIKWCLTGCCCKCRETPKDEQVIREDNLEMKELPEQIEKTI